MCTTSTVIDGWRDSSWPYVHPIYPVGTPHVEPISTGPNAIPWPLIQQDPALAKQMLDLLAKLEAIDKRLGQLEQCKVSAKEKKSLKAKLRRSVAVTEGWWLPTREDGPPRWVLALMNGHVIYSRGGDRHYECQVKTMRRWISRTRAVAASAQIQVSIAKGNDSGIVSPQQPGDPPCP